MLWSGQEQWSDYMSSPSNSMQEQEGVCVLGCFSSNWGLQRDICWPSLQFTILLWRLPHKHSAPRSELKWDETELVLLQRRCSFFFYFLFEKFHFHLWDVVVATSTNGNNKCDFISFRVLWYASCNGIKSTSFLGRTRPQGKIPPFHVVVLTSINASLFSHKCFNCLM